MGRERRRGKKKRSGKRCVPCWPRRRRASAIIPFYQSGGKREGEFIGRKGEDSFGGLHGKTG